MCITIKKSKKFYYFKAKELVRLTPQQMLYSAYHWSIDLPSNRQPKQKPPLFQKVWRVCTNDLPNFCDKIHTLSVRLL